MGLQQQSPPTIFAPQQQAHGGQGLSHRTQLTGGRGGGRQQMPAYHPLAMAGQHTDSPPMPYKRYKTGTIVRCTMGTSQLCGDEDEHTGRLSGGPPQDDPPFGSRLRPTAIPTTTCAHPSNVATAPAPCHFHLHDGNDASDDAGGALPTSDLPCQPAYGAPSHLQ